MGESESKSTYSIDLGTPTQEGREGYYQSYLIARSQMGRLISERWTPDIRAMTLYMISSVADPKTQKDLFAKVDSYYENECAVRLERKRKINPSKDISLTKEEKDAILFESCMRVQGEITLWYDNMVGIVSKNVFNMV